MAKPFAFEKPLGMRDTLPLLYEMKQRIRELMAEEITNWGYQYVDTPTLEYYETVGVESAIEDQQLFKLLDQQGHTVVLRPDMTVPIARVAASRLRNDCFPLRLAYDANVFRAQQRDGGKPAEFEQVGVELIGDGTLSADAEVIALMVSVLTKTGLGSFTIAIGHVGFVNALFLNVLGNEERAEKLRRFLYEKNFVGYREHVKQLGLSSIDRNRLLSLLELRGGKEKMPAAFELVQTEEGLQAAKDLETLWKILESYGIEDYIKLDLNLVSHMSYYTGILFEGYSGKIGSPLLGGGRYDELLEKFERPAPATGFGIRLDHLIEAIGEMSQPAQTRCILFSGERRKEALALATAYRADGASVILQDILGVEDADRFTSRFQDVMVLIGNVKGGADNE